MNIWLKRGLAVGTFSAGMWLIGTGIASAAPAQHPAHPVQHAINTTLGGSLDQLLTTPVHAPVTVRGNSVGLLGSAHSTAPTAHPAGTHAGSGGSGAGTGTGTGTGRPIASVPVSAPITIGGTSIGVLGHSQATGTARAGSGTSAPARSGSVANLPVSAPVTVCGNGVGLLGHATAGCPAGTSNPGGSGTGSGGPGSGASGGSGVTVPIAAPVLVCGNGVGSAGASCGTGSTTDAGSPSGGITVPVTVCGNGVGVLGSSSTDCGSATGLTPPGSTPPAIPPGSGPHDGHGISTHRPGGTAPNGTDGLHAVATAHVDSLNQHALAMTGVNTEGLIVAAVGLLLGGLLIVLGVHGADHLDRRPPAASGDASDTDPRR